MQTPRRLSYRWLISGIFVLVAISVFAMFPKKTVEIEIGPATTYVTYPRLPGGEIDYMSALHERFSIGINPAENAAILVDRAFGPRAIPPSLRSRYFEWMNTESLPDTGEYVISQEDFVKEKGKMADASAEVLDEMRAQFKKSNRPWTPAELPLVAEWLDRNAVPLQLIIRATKLTQYYSPVVSEGGLVGAYSTRHNLIEAGRLLIAQSMLFLGTGDIDGAWNVLSACHRLAGLASQRAATSIQYLIAARIDIVAAQADAELLAREPTTEQIERCFDFPLAPPFARYVDTAIYGDRFEFLETILIMYYEAREQLSDVNTLLRSANLYFDRRTARLRKSTNRARNLSEEPTPPGAIEPIAKTDVKGTIFDPKYQGWTTLAFAGNSQLELVEPRIDTRRKLIRIGFMVQNYRAEHGQFPQTLEDLFGRGIDATPLDSFGNRKLRYIPREDGFQIYSIGPNGEDDGAQEPARGKGDDVVFEVPPSIDE